MIRHINDHKMKKQITAFLISTVMVLSLSGCAITGVTSSSPPAVSAAINIPASTAGMTHAIGLAGVSNARDIGGYKTADGKTVRAGMLIRTGELINANDADKNTLTDTYNVKTIIDLRYDSEIAQSPELTLPGATNIHIPILKDILASSSSTKESHTASSSAKLDKLDILIGYVKSIGDVNNTINNGYISMVTDDYSINGYKKFFDTILSSHNGAIVYHCSGGKDRTGVASMLLLSALSVDRKTAEDDYMLTYDFIKSSIDMTVIGAADKGASKDVQNGIKLVMGVDRKWADSVFDSINTKYGSMDNFLKVKLDLTPDKIKQLKQIYLQ